ncbi:uracil phosphoribosyltransferase-domain-containing protein [Aspergillus undulatus]|uniref:uracil phosphoribosyltransferase-domain-containing protein n=1 Tax=Aspergillus undulatus TaxID=1810928 RepID=UPI003CCCA30F
MLAKFTSRWSFYRVAAYCAGKPDWRGVREVVNPRKGMKLDEVAERHRIEKEVFRRVSAPRVIGLYGIPGCGKSYIMEKLKHQLGDSGFEYFEGSEVIGSVTPGGLEAFKRLDDDEKNQVRKFAIDTIKYTCAQSGKVGIVTSHFTFWDQEEDERALRVYTQADLNTYTHILYVNTPVEETAKQRSDDKERGRPNLPIEHLQRWQKAEIDEIRRLCRENKIHFAMVYPNLIDKLASMIRDFQLHNESHNTSIAEQYLDNALSEHYDKLQTVLFLDADKTLAAIDTSALFWKKVKHSRGEEDPLTTLFKSQLHYSYIAFRQAMLMYEESVSDKEFDAICEEVAASTTLYPQMSSLLRQAGRHNHVRPVIVTCGLRRVWEKIIAKEGLSEMVKIVGGGRLSDEFVVTPSVKRSLVTRARQVHEACTWVFGDSPVDLPMMVAAHKAIVIVGDQHNRSKSMDRELLSAMVSDRLQARQALLPSSSTIPRLDLARLPVVDITEKSFVDSVFQPHKPSGGLKLYHATDTNAAKLLSTPTRDDLIRGPPLQEFHKETGVHLARKYLVELIGVEPFTMRHPQGHDVDGYCLLNEDRTLIVGLYRGGLFLASGINKVFPKAQLTYVKEPKHVEAQHLEDIVTVILVDDVINSGKSVVEFVRHIQGIHGTVRIIVVAGVVQDKAVKGCSPICALASSIELTVITLRLSGNKYTGKGTTDTGNRLFNTTHWE